MKETTKPGVSVLLPVHNGAAYLKDAVESILAQTFRDFELIIVDDGSTDQSLKILRGYEASDSRIRLFSRPRTGYVAALNEMLAVAGGGQGKLLARMDADDIAHPGRLRQQVEFLRDHPEVVCVGSAFDIIDEQSCRLTRLKPPETDAEIQQLLLKGHTAICHPSVMMRADAIRRVGGYDERFTSVEDLDLFLKLGEVGRLANLPRALLQYRIHTQSVSAEAGAGQRRLGRLVCEEAWKRRGIENGTFEAGDEWRPGPGRSSRHKFALRYGWWAFNSGQKRAALRYGARAASLKPWRWESWALLGSAAIKPRPWPSDHASNAGVVNGAPSVVPLDRSRGSARARPVVSVLMPVYNAEQFLAESIESILDQSFHRFEFIIVDDGSTDDSPTLLRDYARIDSRIRVLGQERGGYISALNHGLEYARGRYIARMDADDHSDPTRLELQVDRLEEDPQLVAVGSCAIAVDPQGRFLGHFDVPLSHEELERVHLSGESAIHHPAVMMRRRALERVGRYRAGFAPAEDYDLWLRLAEVGKLANLPERLISKRLTTSGVVGSTLTLQERIVRQALEDAWERRGLQGEPPTPTRALHSQGDLYRQWGWMAVKSHSLYPARLYAARSIIRDPLHEHTWRLAYCAVRGR